MLTYNGVLLYTLIKAALGNFFGEICQNRPHTLSGMSESSGLWEYLAVVSIPASVGQ